MNKKLLLTSIVAIAFAMPAMATPTYSSNEFPSNGLMQADYTYVGQATSANMDGVTSGSVNAVAEYEWDIIPIDPKYYLPANSTSVSLCTSGYFCPGVATNYSDRTPHVQSYVQGLNQCPDGFGNSDAGASANTQCYRACDIANMGDTIENFEHVATLAGRDYYGGTSADTCVPATCEDGYSVRLDPDFNTVIGNSSPVEQPVQMAHLNHEVNGGSFYVGFTYMLDYGESGTLGVDSWSSSRSASGEFETTTEDIPTLDSGNNCYCKISSYSGYNGTLNTPWVFLAGPISYDNCRILCNESFVNVDANSLAIRTAMFETGPVSCEPTVTITINWTGATDAAINANNAGTCTYGGDIRTPQSAIPETGKTFKGWRFVRP